MSFTEVQSKRMQALCNAPKLSLLKAVRVSDGVSTSVVCSRVEYEDGSADYTPLAEIPDGDMGTLYAPEGEGLEVKHTEKEVSILAISDELKQSGEA